MLRTILILLSLLALGPVPAGEQVRDYMKLHVVESEFEFVRQDIELAITERGMVINNVSYIGNMLARTAQDLGAARTLFGQAEALEFCSATVSREMMEADPHNIVFCPYIIAIYTLPDEEGKVYVAYRRPQLVGDAASRESLRQVEQLLDAIIAEALP